MISEDEEEAEIDRLASSIAREAFLAFRQSLSEAGKEERLELIAKYGPTLRELHRMTHKTAHAPKRRRYPGQIETK